MNKTEVIFFFKPKTLVEGENNFSCFEKRINVFTCLLMFVTQIVLWLTAVGLFWYKSICQMEFLNLSPKSCFCYDSLQFPFIKENTHLLLILKMERCLCKCEKRRGFYYLPRALLLLDQQLIQKSVL